MALVEEDDFELVDKYKWHAQRNKGGFVYASTSIGGKAVYMHRMIAGVTDRNIHVDHRNTITLDNRRRNLRVCTQAHNEANKPKRSIKSTSRFKGVSKNKRCGKWAASIKISGKSKGLGYFDNEEEAALAYDKAARELHGEFHRSTLA